MNQPDRHNYEYDVELDGPTAPARVLRMVGNDKKVLEIGAGPGSITKHLLHSSNCKITALELDESAIEKLSQYASHIYQANLNDPDWVDTVAEAGPFEVVVAADVLEHLYDPWTTLSRMKTLLTDDGSIVISLPHVGHSAVAACLMDEDFEYRDWGLLDKTHIRFFGLKNIQALVKQAGLRIDHAEFVVVRPEESEFAEKWNKLQAHQRKALSESRFGMVYQVVVKAIPENRARDAGIDLLSLPVERPASDPMFSIRSAIARRLPKNVKAVLKKYL